MVDQITGINWQDAGVAAAIVTAAVFALRAEIGKQAKRLSRQMSQFIKQNQAEHADTVAAVKRVEDAVRDLTCFGVSKPGRDGEND